MVVIPHKTSRTRTVVEEITADTGGVDMTTEAGLVVTGSTANTVSDTSRLGDWCSWK